MTKEELSIERERFIYYYEKYPIKQGTRTDLNGGDTYSRPKLILDNFTHIWPNTITYISHNLNKIYEHLKDDDDRLFFTRKLFHHKWKPVSLCKFVDEGYSKMDTENKFEDLLYNNEKVSIKKTKELLSNYYKKNVGHLYVMKFESDSEYIPKTSVKKIGFSYDLQRRLKSISTWNPYTVVPMVYIIVEGYSDEEIERLVHKRFARENYKLELFLDEDNKMVNEVIDFVSKLPNCKIKKMYTEKQLRLKYKIKTKTTNVFVPNYYNEYNIGKLKNILGDTFFVKRV